VIKPTRTAERYLGFWLDEKLNFDVHRKKLLDKGRASLQALRSLSGSTWGASLLSMRRLYQAIIIPQTLYGLAAWFEPQQWTKSKQIQIAKPFSVLQHQAACVVSGAFRTTAAAALCVELGLMPMRILMTKIANETALRIRTGPAYAVPRSMIHQRSKVQRDRSGWSPMEAQAWKKGGCLTAPPDTLVGEWENRVAYAQAP
jgi:hypothetical protein